MFVSGSSSTKPAGRVAEMQGITATAALLVEGFLKTTLVLVPALLGAAACRRRPASFRHFLLSFALIGLLFLPLFRLLPGGWKTPLLPARPAAAVSPSAVFSSPPPAALSGASAAVSFLSVRDGSPSSRSGESAAGPSNAPTRGRRRALRMQPSCPPRKALRR